MLEIYHPPHVAREEAARKMLWRVLLSFAILAVSMIPFFFQLTKDSEQNRDAVYKTTSTETELCLILVLAVVLAVIFYLSVTGTRLSGKIRAQFKEWAFYRGTLYHISARIPGAGAQNRVSSAIARQEQLLSVLHQPDTLAKLLDGTLSMDGIRVTPVTEVTNIRKTKHTVHVLFHGKHAKISKEISNYDSLMKHLRSLYISRC